MRGRNVIIFLLLTLILAAYPVTRYSLRAYVAWDARQSEIAIEKAYISLSQTCLEEFPALTVTDKIKNLRHCVFVNSKFGADKANEVYWKDWHGVVSWAQEHADGKRSDKPPMECFYRDKMLRNLLEIQNIESRQIVLTLNEDGFDGHVVTEIYNSDTNKWEMHDPLYDAEYRLVDEGQPATLKHMLSLPIDKIVPCDFNGECGWARLNPEGMSYTVLKRYWNAAWVAEEETLYVAPGRFDVQKKRLVNGVMKNFCEHQPDRCKRIVEIKP